MSAPSTSVAADTVMRVDRERFRAVLGRFPTVVVVTGMVGGRPVGMTIDSFPSLSLEPRLVGFSVNRRAQTWPLLQAAGTFCVNVLGEQQADLALSFAKRAVDRFAHVEWAPSQGGSPVIEAAIAWMDCEPHTVYPVGDHHFVVAAVRTLEARESGTGPLLFYRRTYGTFQHAQ